MLDEFDQELAEPLETQPKPLPCEEPDCKNAGEACFYPDNETEVPSHWYCSTHAFKYGFCWGCGLFWGGCESFEFARLRGGIQGLCENCSFAARDEFERGGEDYEDEDDYFYGYE